MKSNIEQTIIEFLNETAELVCNIEQAPYETVVELYDLLDITAKAATENIKIIDPELRVEICASRDVVLNRIVDLHDFSSMSKIGGEVYTPALESYRYWKNVELLKEKCLPGYMLSKVIGAKPVAYFCDERVPYPYLSELPGLELLYEYKEYKKDLEDSYCEHLKKNFHKMDVIVLNGICAQSSSFSIIYRKFRPKGKIYFALDTNSGQISEIKKRQNPKHPNSIKSFESCDVIAASCTHIRNELNRDENVNFPCYYISNAFFRVSNADIKVSAKNKKNVILTVGRIGSWQKNNEELVVGFVKASETLKDWTLKFVGPIEGDFLFFVNNILDKFPDLKKRIILTGSIVNKIDLYKKYAEAKIFALTSVVEGAPNVYAEALFHGCKFVTSDIDAADDMICDGILGRKYKLGDIDALSAALIEVANEPPNIETALEYGRRYFDWERNAKKIAYALFR